MKCLFGSLVLALGFVPAGPSAAALITDAAALPGVSGIVDFRDQPEQFTQGPTQVGDPIGEDIVFTASDLSAGFSYFAYSLGDNGIWGPNGFTYAFINSDFGSIRFRFDGGPVSAVGGLVNYVPGTTGDLLIRALAADLTVLEEFNISSLAAIATPGGENVGAFRGIVRPTEEIFAFELEGGFGVLTDLTFFRTPTAVPEPASFILFGLGLIGLLGCYRREKQFQPDQNVGRRPLDK